MRQSHLNFVYSLLVGLAVLGLTACGQVDPLNEFESDLLSDISTQETQQEIHQVMEVVQSTIVAGLTDQQSVVAGDCKPKFNMSFSGVGFTFANDGTCKLSGDVSIKFFPVRAVVDLDVIGMKHIESMSFEADIDISGSKVVTVDWELLNGRIELKDFKLFPMGELVLNGRAHAEIGKGTFIVQARTNAFAGDTGFGFAVLSAFNKTDRSLQACLLTGGVGNDPMAGETKACMAIIK